MKNSKITKKLIKYFLFTITLVIFICFLISSSFISKLYRKQQYKSLKASGEEIYESLKNNTPIEELQNNAVLITNSSIVPLTKSKMGVVNMIKSIDIKTLHEEGILNTKNGESFLMYKLETPLGHIITFQNAAPYAEFLKIIYIVLISVFIIAIIISIPIFYFLGRKFTEPILQLKNTSNEISKGNFEIMETINTGDEIEDLYSSISNMSNSLKEKHSFQKKFIANISHDFRTPLSIIRNYSEAISDGILSEDETAIYSKEIINEVDKLNAMVIDLLEISKLQEGKLKLTLNKIDISIFLKQCIESFAAISKEKNINLILTSYPIEVLMDEKYMYRVMYNFINNAIKFSNKNSVIEISSVKIIEGVKVSVKDHGIGIPQNIINDIWYRYYKDSKSGGIGLGLPICKEILDHHNFKYGVESKENEGTNFYFIIPN
ncbi:HAMP domain-containing sensor histidine kinase [Clostridium sp. KNHs214]|uniref:sensor histidine kinase n=1 Tax=Clostridium sp. KNHs214 TaxID=1540257 RepID=UPI0005568FDC|nr:HAMP domain-containing sensor histidine kinase [Clostridium sp. KNHs214]